MQHVRNPISLARLVAQEGLARDFTRPYVVPDGITGLSEHALAGRLG